MKTNKEYVSSPNNCPKCDGNDVEGNSVEINSGYCTQECVCIDCHFTWNDQYILTGFISNE